MPVTKTPANDAVRPAAWQKAMREMIADDRLTKREVTQFVAQHKDALEYNDEAGLAFQALGWKDFVSHPNLYVTKGAKQAINDTLATLPMPGSANVYNPKDGDVITLHEGQDLHVALDSNPSTGYDWEAKYVDRSMGYPTAQFTPHSYIPQPGDGGTTSLRWQANPFMGPGDHHVTLEYARPWDKDHPAKTINLTIRVLANEA